MITAAAMLSAMLPASGHGLPFHTVYVATAIASGSLVGSWMNDSGFWLFSKMGGVTELETVKSWTPVLAAVGVTSMVMTIGLALLVPLRSRGGATGPVVTRWRGFAALHASAS